MEWGEINAEYAFGSQGRLFARRILREDGSTLWSLKLTGYTRPLRLRLSLDHAGKRYRTEAALQTGRTLRVLLKDGVACLNRHTEIPGEPLPKRSPLHFAKPNHNAKPPALRRKNYLIKRLEKSTREQRPR